VKIAEVALGHPQTAGWHGSAGLVAMLRRKGRGGEGTPGE